MYGYLNETLIGKFAADKSVFIKPTIGINKVQCTDGSGNTRTISFEVKEF
ncbi:MAG: hypothetical protein ACRCVT_12100 [Leadbetterella sp.]